MSYTTVGTDKEPKLGVKYPNTIVEVTEDIILTALDNGKTFVFATDLLTADLPPVTAAPSGTHFTFRNIGADGNNIITISPNSADAIFGTVSNAAADSVASGVDDKDLINTKATANKGDYVIIESDGVTGWYIAGGVGIWASEA